MNKAWTRSLSLPLCLGLLSVASCTPPEEGGAPGPSVEATGGRTGTGGKGGSGGGSGGAGPASGGSGGGSTASGGSGGGSSPAGGSGGASAPGGAGGGATPGEGGSPGADAGQAGAGETSAPPPVSNPGDPATPGATDLTKHKYSKVVKVDTTAAGANVAGDVAKFPIAVVLNAMNFDFAQAKTGGEDIRFANADGSLLPYAIESWDATAKLGVAWVKFDVKGNNNTQSFVMHWGNPSAESASASKALFNKEDGYLGVYHLNDEPGDMPDGYKDASWNGAHLTGRMMDAATRAPSRIGIGVSLSNPGGQGKNQWIGGEGPKFESDFNATATQSITATAWALGRSFSGYYETVISKGDRSWTLQRDYQGRMETCTWSGSYHACAITRAPTVNKWTHYMVVQNARQLILYVDGKRAAATGSFGQTSTHGFAIAHNFQAHNNAVTGKREWDGLFDEARVMRGEKDANWALLDFESQKEGAKLLSFGATVTK